MESHWKIILCFSVLATGCAGMNRYNDYMSEPACKNSRSACDEAEQYLTDHRGARDDRYLYLQRACDESIRSCQDVLRDNARQRGN